MELPLWGGFYAGSDGYYLSLIHIFTFTAKEDMDIDSFKEAVEGVDQWFVEELKNQGYDDGQELVDAFKSVSYTHLDVYKRQELWARKL